MLQDSGWSRVIACHSWDIGNMLLYHHYLKNINGGKKKWWLGRDMVWVLVGVRGCVAVDTGHSLVTLLSLSLSVKDWSLHKASWASHRFIIPSTYLCLGAWKTCCSLFVGSGSFWTDCQGFIFGGGGPCTALSSGLRSGGLESQFGWGPRTPG